jgi:tripartite-type tricarboxylate transporter receptor subunit TctC
VKAEPGQRTWATSGAGGIGHLTGEYLKIEAAGSGRSTSRTAAVPR